MSTRDFIEKDYYGALGVPQNADAPGSVVSAAGGGLSGSLTATIAVRSTRSPRR